MKNVHLFLQKIQKVALMKEGNEHENNSLSLSPLFIWFIFGHR